MSVGISTALLIGAGVTAGTSIAGGIMGSNAAHDAADQQTTAEQKAIDEWNQIKSENAGLISPYTSAGSSALPMLQALLAKGAPTFTAPTGVTEQNDPGYQFRLAQGQKALEQSAAARGGALGGGELMALDKFGQDYGSNEYANVYNRALQGYGANLSGYQTNLGGLQSLANLGLSATGLGLNSNLGVGQGITQAVTGIGNAQAAGTVGGANAWSSALGGIGNNISNLTMLNSILNKPNFNSVPAGQGIPGNGNYGPPVPPGYYSATGGIPYGS